MKKPFSERTLKGFCILEGFCLLLTARCLLCFYYISSLFFLQISNRDISFYLSLFSMYFNLFLLVFLPAPLYILDNFIVYFLTFIVYCVRMRYN